MDGDMGKSANERTCDEQHVETKHERSNCNCTLGIDVILIDSKHDVILYLSLHAALQIPRTTYVGLIDIVYWTTNRI